MPRPHNGGNQFPLLSEPSEPSTISSIALQARSTKRMKERMRTIHIPWGTRVFSDADFGTGAGCSVYADTGSLIDVTADDMVIIPAVYQWFRQQELSVSTNSIYVRRRADLTLSCKWSI